MESRLFLGDCEKILDTLPEKSIDLVLTDPPYNVSRPNNFQTLGSACRVGMDFGEWDKGFNQKSWISHLPRLLKENANVVIFNAWENLSTIKEACEENYISIKRCLCLSKNNPAPFNRDRMFVNDVEFALWGVYNSKDKPSKWTFNRYHPVEKCVMPTTVQSAKYHPTSKDPKIFAHLIKLLSNEGDAVLDPFTGGVQLVLFVKNLIETFMGAKLMKNTLI